MAKSYSSMSGPFQPSFRRSYQTALSFSVAKSCRPDSESLCPRAAPIALPDVITSASADVGEGLLDNLPLEITQNIASYIENDKDLENFRLSCRAINSAIDEARGYFWRCRFKSRWEEPRAGSQVKSGADFKKAYRRRNHVLKNSYRVQFQLGKTQRENDRLEVLKDMILDSYSGMTEENKIIYQSRNLDIIKSWTYDDKVDILCNIFKPSFTYTNFHGDRYHYKHGTSLLRTIQVLLAPVMLDLDENNPLIRHTYNFPESQQVAYGTNQHRPIIGGLNGLEVDMDWALHQLNFWKYHMIREEECTLYTAFQAALAQDEKPVFHTSPLKDNTTPAIGKYWKGAYAFVSHEDTINIREGNNEEPNIQDEFNSDEEMGDLQDMALELNDQGEDTWNPLFEEMLNSLKQPESTTRTRAQRRSSPPDSFFCQQRSFRFGGIGADDTEDFRADGWFNQLPPQNGVPGWQRMTMMKYYTDEFGIIDYDSLWAYEGIVLPGGKIVVGRWWSPTTTLSDGEKYSGPFILWCTDAAHPESFVEGDE